MIDKSHTRVAQLVEHRQNTPEVNRSTRFPRAKWGEMLGRDECPYLRRWVVEGKSGRSVRIHHFYRSDDARHFHDHPWWFVTLVVRGGYTDVSEMGEDKLRPGSVRYRSAPIRLRLTMTGVKLAYGLSF